MKIVESQEKTIKENKVISIICNCCGKIEKGEHVVFETDITPIEISFGYGSKFDLETWKIDICDECLEKWVSTFKYPIEKQEII